MFAGSKSTNFVTMKTSTKHQATRGFLTEIKGSYLSTDFGEELLMKWLEKSNQNTDEILAKIGRYTRGKRVGKLRGTLEWYKVTAGGWDYSGGGIIYPGIKGWRVTDYSGNLLAHGFLTENLPQSQSFISFYYAN